MSNILQDIAELAARFGTEYLIAILVSKTEPLLDSKLGILFLITKTSLLSLIEKHWIVDSVLINEAYSKIYSDEAHLRSQGKSELAIKAFLFREIVKFRWNLCSQSVKFNLTTKKIMKPK
jgi:hypothetical protein